MKADTPLRLALLVNAVFSLCCAVLMLARPASVGEWLGVEAPAAFLTVGAGLIFFAGGLGYVMTRSRLATWLALLISAADFLWVAGSIVLLVAFPEMFSPRGQLAILAVAGVVFGFASWQLWAIGRAHRNGKNGAYRHCIIVETNAPAARLWEVLSNIGEIRRYMPSLTDSTILDGKEPGVGAVRACRNREGHQWSEECTNFNPGRSFEVRFLTEAPNFPFPAREMRGGWEVTPTSAGSHVMVWWELVPKGRLPAAIVLPLLGLQADRDFPGIIGRMAAAALDQDTEMEPSAKASVGARLVPSLC